MSSSISAKVDWTTDTSFGNHYDLLERTRNLIQAKGRPLSGLVIGAGLGYDELMRQTGKTLFGFAPSDVFSWEPLEMLYLLRAFHPESNVTVIDPNDNVCKTLSEQKAFPVNDFYRLPRNYVKGFLTRFPHQRLDDLALEEVNKELNCKGSGHQVSVVASATVPILDNILNQDFLSESADLEQYDVVALLESGLFIVPRWKVVDKVIEVLRQDGILLFANSFNEWEPSHFTSRGLSQKYLKKYQVETRSLDVYETGRHAIFVK